MRAYLRLEGSIESGFDRCSLTLKERGCNERVIVGSLPASKELAESSNNANLVMQIGNVSHSKRQYGDAILQFKKEESQKFAAWTDSLGFREISFALSENARDIEILTVLCDDVAVWRLPWEALKPSLPVAFSPTFYRNDKQVSLPSKIRIFSAYSTADPDRAPYHAIEKETFLGLNGIADVEITEPTAREFVGKLNCESYQVVGFSGHGEDSENRIHFSSDDDVLHVDRFCDAIGSTIDNGCKIIILSICGGQSIAKELVERGAEMVVCFRGQTPSKLVAEFHRHFIPKLTEGKTILEAFKYARSILKNSTDFWKAEGYLTLAINPAALVPSLPSLDRHRGLKKKAAISGIASFAALGVVAIAQSLGMLQTWELEQYDRLTRWRAPLIPANEELAIIRITEGDLKYQKENGYEGIGSFSDKALVELMDENPDVFFVSDVLHDFEFEDIVQPHHLERYVGVCISEAGGNEGVISPPGARHFGYANNAEDVDGGFRRFLAIQADDNVCGASRSLALVSATAYTGAEAISDGENITLKIGNRSIRIRSLPRTAGGYSLTESEVRGYQSLLRYHSAPTTIRLKDALESGLPDGIKIAIVGVDVSYQDRAKTPLGVRAGVYVHANALAMLLDAIQGKRGLPWWLPQPLEYLWIGLWGVAGTVAILSPHPCRNAAIVLVAAYTSTSVVFLVWDGCIPVIASTLGSVLGVLFAGGTAVIINGKLSDFLLWLSGFLRRLPPQL